MKETEECEGGTSYPNDKGSNIGEEVRELSPHYRTGTGTLGKDFFEVCFRWCSHYSRAAGYFSSSALITWFGGLARLLREGDDMTVRLLASYQLSDGDAEALRLATEPEERRRILDRTSDELIGFLVSLVEDEKSEGARLQLFAWLVAKGHIELRFAHPIAPAEDGIFHEKIGVFDFPWGDSIAFTGSANETGGGHTRNYESIDVYRSWVEADARRIEVKREQFEEAWEGRAEGLEVAGLSSETLQRIRRVAPRHRPAPPDRPIPPPASENPWEHQQEAMSCYLDARKGILEMATGTGKTRTALRIVSELFERDTIDSVIVTTDGNDLLRQWCDELEAWGRYNGPRMVIFRHFERFGEIGRFVMAKRQCTAIVVSRQNLLALFKRLDIDRSRRAIVIHDEVHGLGQPSLHDALRGKHAQFTYVLGLSATPERAYDAEGNAFIENEVGPTVFDFPLERAIRDGVLCEFDYTPLSYELTENDRDRIRAVFSRAHAARKQGKGMSEQDIWIEIAKVYKTAEDKLPVFKDYLHRNPDVIRNAIIFVETREYGNELLPILHRHTSRYRTYYSGDEESNLTAFSKGDIDCLVTCHRLSQGIDIRALKNVVLFASARSKLETIQRIGRCLRSDPNNPAKRAHVVDFVREQAEGDEAPNADSERADWLREISSVRRTGET